MTKATTFSLPLLLSLALAACGGGGGGDSAVVAPGTVLPPTTVTIPTATYAAGSAELGGYTVLQQARVLCGFGALRQNTRLDAAALNHARYLTSISSASGTSVLSHYEDIPTDPYYTGYFPWDRTTATGYGDQVAEILEATVWDYDTGNPPVFPALAQRGADSMRSLLNTVYHLTGAMYAGADVGFGADVQTIATGTTSRREEYRFGSLNGYQTTTINLGSGNVATYPCQGSTDIPSAFVPANESPNPFPAMTSTSQTVGPPIYLKVDAGQVLRVTSSSVSQNGVSVPTTVLTAANDPNRDLGANEVFVIPTIALSSNTNYQVSLSGTISGAPFSRSFSMSTGQ
ncbi:MAG: hypothetical protein PHQ58_00570 [Rhodoferax sp.]|uniref:hypothetical protein n=1 Tax=Rhodoferax sp. TaxID=50421 RepID=UPI002624FC36|nr:hypothetical protein [Rhodoferax sp.]MDD2878903.1 hypothetical protein [Rhodoferax sp.]